jgi:exosome complex RNA-binding protein Rrp42 (RNase PH superfamily)
VLPTLPSTTARKEQHPWIRVEIKEGTTKRLLRGSVSEIRVDMEDDRNSDDEMDVAVSEDVTSTTNTPHEPRQQQNEKDDRATSRHHQQQQQQAQNLETWLQLIETAIQPFQPPNQKAPINSKSDIYTRTPPQYTIQHGILSSKSNHPTEVVGSSMVKVVTTSPRNTSNNITETTTTTTSTILIATVTLQVGQPSIMTPKQGDIMVTLVQGSTGSGSSSSSSSSNNSMTNAHGIHTIQSKLQRVLDENMDLEQLHVIEGKIAYRLVVTITILFVESITGLTLFDACLVAAIAALLDTKLPTRPLIHDGVLYNSSTTSLSSSTDTATGDSSSDPTIEQKPLHMPVLPISFTAIGVRFPDDTMEKDTRTSLHWIGDPTMDEQILSESTVATIVMNAAAIITNTKIDQEEEEEDQEDILCLQLTPNTTTTTGTTTHIMSHSLAASNVPTMTTTTAVVVSCHDVDTVVSMARRHVQSMYTLVQPPKVKNEID